LGVPKGSGLGTSSILCAACAQALLELFGIPHGPEEITRRVLVMEQLMDTGGGWQDQVGGLLPGIKLIRSQPGLLQNPQSRPLELSEHTRAALDRRFALIYTGQRRLARNLLREVVGRYLGREPEALETLDQIQELAVLMAFQLERGNLDAFGQLLNRHWALSQALDPGCANTLIHQIFASVADLIQGQMICGAGGGGFLQVLLKENVTQVRLEARLRQIFHDNPVAVWPCRILWS
jgi:fucokinase